jgi:hypothetical protein
MFTNCNFPFLPLNSRQCVQRGMNARKGGQKGVGGGGGREIHDVHDH